MRMRYGLGALLAAVALAGCGGQSDSSAQDDITPKDYNAPVIQSVSLLADTNGAVVAKGESGKQQITLQMRAVDDIDTTAFCLGKSSTAPKASDSCFLANAVQTINVGPLWRVYARDAAGNISMPSVVRGPCSEAAYAASDSSSQPTVCLLTSDGEIVVALDTKASNTVTNFSKYVADGFYAGTLFHRIMSNFMVQGGGFELADGERVKKPPTYDPIELEKTSDTGLSNVVGSIAMARSTESNSATSEFFINVVNNSSTLDASLSGDGYAVFGRVIYGLDTAVQAIRNKAVINNGANEISQPVDDLFIFWAYQMK